MADKKIKVLHLIKSLGRGGAEMLLPETIRLHHKDEFEFHCIYFLPWKNQLVEPLLQKGTVVTCFTAKNNLQILRQVPSLIRYIKTHKIDVVHSHLPWAGFASRLLFKRTGIPVVYTEHNKQERYHKLTRMLNKTSFNWQSRVIAVSADVEDSIRKHIRPSVPVQTVLNGVNTQLFKRDIEGGRKIRKEYGIDSDAIVIGNLSVFRFQKRLPEWLTLIKSIHAKYPKTRAILVGAGPLQEVVESKIKELQLEEVVVRPGLQTNTIDWLSAMDIFMMSSEFEGLPIALLEAMSCECAIVSTSAGGIKEVIRDREDGMLTDVGEWEKLADMAIQLIEDTSLLKRLQGASRQRVATAFSLRLMVDQLELIYRDIIRPRNPNEVTTVNTMGSIR